MARLIRTYTSGYFYIITPSETQQILVNKIIEHWTNGSGSRSNPDRKEAFLNIRIVSSIDDAKNEILGRTGKQPITIATTAKKNENQIKWENLYRLFSDNMVNKYLLLFGTAHGLSPYALENADYILSPIEGNSQYNHLSVRCAAGIILDRIYNTINELKNTGVIK
jgi:tRNA (guanine37-N1)-methyltransferase